MLLMLSDKGKYAVATEHRRFIWKEIIWPLVLEVNDVSFTLRKYQQKREKNLISAECFGYTVLVNKLHLEN